MKSDIIFYQLFEHETSTYTYLIADKESHEAALIDPVLECVDRDLKLVQELGLDLKFVFDTHIHADHVTGAGEIRKRTKAKTAVSKDAKIDCVDIPLSDGEELFLGKKKIKAISTSGHTNTCMTFHFEGMLFTGDSLMIRGCGRTDFQNGSSETMYSSVHDKLYKFDDDMVIYPAHDYKGQTATTIGLEKRFNPRLNLTISKDSFKKIMSDLKLAEPKRIHQAVPANLACGEIMKTRLLSCQDINGIPEVSVEEVLKNMHHVTSGKICLIDVRRPEEFNNELGHIKNAELVTLGPDLEHFLEQTNKDQEIVFICRSGARSANATAESIDLGFNRTANMMGGMIQWNQKSLPIEKN